MLGVEAFTVLAILEAQDRISSIIERVDKTLESFGETAKGVADSVNGAGITIDESLLKTSSGTDAVELANARLAESQRAVTMATQAQADAERVLMTIRAQSAAGEMDEAEAASELSTAMKMLQEADKNLAKASTEATAAQERQMAVMAALADVAARDAEAEGVDITTTDGLAAAKERGAKAAGLMNKAMTLGGIAIAAAGYESVKAAMNFQDATTHLVTDAGESSKNLAMVQQGILNVSASTGVAANDLVNAMYHIESSGVHGQAALNMLTVAAQGAKVGGADLDTTTKALMGTMTAYSAKGYTTTQMMNALIATVGQGDMRMQDLASSLSSVTAVAAAAHLPFEQVAGAIATMTAQGFSADRATQDLAHTIGVLQNPSAQAIAEMQGLGLNVNDVEQNLGKRGLTGTLQMFTEALAAHTKNGDVFISTLKSSQVAAANMKTALASMSPQLQKLATGLQNGTMTLTQYDKAIKTLPIGQQNLAHQWVSLNKQADSFNQLLKSGKPEAQTFNTALATMMGGSTGLDTALMLSGTHMGYYQNAVKNVGDALKSKSKDVENWSTIQATLKQKLDQAKTSVEAVGISIGTMLLPVVSKVAGWFATGATAVSHFISQHKTLVGLLLSVAAGLTAGMLAMKAWTVIMGIWEGVQTTVNTLLAIFDAEADANPIGLIVIAIAALVGGLIYAYNHFKAFRDIVHDVFDFMKTAVTDVIDFVRGHWRLIISIIGGPIGLTVALLTKYWKDISNGAVRLWHDLSGAFMDIVHAVETVWHTVVNVWNTIWGVTSEVWNAISAFFKKWWPLLLVLFMPMIALVMSIWNHFHSVIIDTAKTVWNAVLTFLKTIWHLIQTEAKITWMIIYDTIVKPIELIWAFLQKVWNAVKPYLEGAWNWIKNTAESIWNGIYTSIISPIEKAWNDLTSWMGKIQKAISDGLNTAWTDVKNIGSEFVKIGEDIVNGIVQGIGNVGSNIGNTLKGWANSALHDVTSFLGIGSPSRVFRDKVGQWIPAGIADGVTRNSGSVKTALQNLSKQLPGMVNTTVGSSLAAGFTGAPGAGSGANTGLVINLDLRGAQVMSDRDMQTLVDKIGRKVATVVLPQAGVRIRS